ncbi:BgTH12-02887 [Blumeria graminis f. sp. triticale]|uniref:BgTH12-02887 n=1 Tax=Blumeria graminis f. sp. triticale TaxID=1689686 RepID=A0A9W4DK48_BLUGR|nr:BgTH12-02887 [Blumeria graminis f. sp. triticale]
MRGGDKVRYWV